MDDNTNQQEPQNAQQGVSTPPTLQGSFTPPAQNTPQQTPAQPIFQQTQPAAPQQSIQSVVNEPSQQPQAGSEGPRITLDDLYGPSTASDHAAVQNIAPAQSIPEPNQQLPVPPQPVQTTQEPAQPNTSVPPQPVQNVQEPMQPIFPQNPQPQQPVQPALPVEQKVQQANPQTVESPFSVQSSSSPQEVVEEKDQMSNQPENSGRGFHLPSILRFVIGGAIVLIVILLMWGIGSLLFSNKSATSGGKVTLTYWGLWEDPNVMNAVFADFEKQHPNITVTYTREDPVDYVKRFLQRTNDGNGPDLLRIHNTWVYPLQSSLLPLPSNVLTNKDVASNYPPTVAKDLEVNGALYGLPLQMDTLALYVNTDMFTHAGAKVPTTWNDFITVAKALTVKDPNGKIQTSGAAMGTYGNVEHSPDIMSMLFLQNGANLQKLESGENANDALSFYTSFANAEGNVWDTTLDNSLHAFASGKVAMYFGYSYDIFAIKATNPSLHFAVYPVPHLPGRDISIASYWVEAVSSKSKHQKEALELMQYLSQKDTQTKLYTEESKLRGFGELYARNDLSQTLTTNSILAPFVQQFKTAQSSFFASNTDYDEYNGALNQYLGNAINSVLKGTSESTAAQTLSQGVSQILSQFGQQTP